MSDITFYVLFSTSQWSIGCSTPAKHLQACSWLAAFCGELLQYEVISLTPTFLSGLVGHASWVAVLLFLASPYEPQWYWCWTWHMGDGCNTQVMDVTHGRWISSHFVMWVIRCFTMEKSVTSPRHLCPHQCTQVWKYYTLSMSKYASVKILHPVYGKVCKCENNTPVHTVTSFQVLFSHGSREVWWKYYLLII